jgi:hypothetical protein
MFGVIESWLDEADRAIDRWTDRASSPPSPPRPSDANRHGPLSGMIGSLLGLDSWTFYVPFGGSWTGAEVEALLGEHGVRIRRKNVVNDDIFFNVKLSQAEWAEYVMLRAGVPLKYGLYSERNKQRFAERSDGPPDASYRKTSPLSKLGRRILGI